jgi:hypothetical protein
LFFGFFFESVPLVEQIPLRHQPLEIRVGIHLLFGFLAAVVFCRLLLFL